MNYALIMAGRCCRECSKLDEVVDKHLYKGDMFSFFDKAAGVLEEEKYRIRFDQEDDDVQAQFESDYDKLAELLLDARNMCDHCNGSEALIFSLIEKDYVQEIEFLIRSAQDERRRMAEKAERKEEIKETIRKDGKLTRVSFDTSRKKK